MGSNVSKLFTTTTNDQNSSTITTTMNWLNSKSWWQANNSDNSDEQQQQQEEPLVPEPPESSVLEKRYLKEVVSPNLLTTVSSSAEENNSSCSGANDKNCSCDNHQEFTTTTEDDNTCSTLLIEPFLYASSEMEVLPTMNCIRISEESSLLEKIKSILIDKNGDFSVDLSSLSTIMSSCKLGMPKFVTKITKCPRKMIVKPPPLSEIPAIFSSIIKTLTLTNVGISVLIKGVLTFVESFVDECIERIPNRRLKRWFRNAKSVVMVILSVVSTCFIVSSLVASLTVSWASFFGVMIAALIGIVSSMVFDFFFSDICKTFCSWLCDQLELVFECLKNTELFKIIRNVIDMSFIGNLVKLDADEDLNVPETTCNTTTADNHHNSTTTTTTNESGKSLQQKPTSLSSVMDRIRVRCVHTTPNTKIQHSCDEDADSSCLKETNDRFIFCGVCKCCTQERALHIALHIRGEMVLSLCKECFIGESNEDLLEVIQRDHKVERELLDFFFFSSKDVCSNERCLCLPKCYHGHCESARLLIVNSTNRVRIGDYCSQHETLEEGERVLKLVK